MQEELKNIESCAIEDIKNTNTSEEIDKVRVKYLGKKGELTKVLRGMGKLSSEQRPVIGKIANIVRENIEQSIVSRINNIKQEELNNRLKGEVIDVTMPGQKITLGKKTSNNTEHGRLNRYIY